MRTPILHRLFLPAALVVLFAAAAGSEHQRDARRQRAPLRRPRRLQKINPLFVQGFRIRLKATLDVVDLKGTAGIPAGTSVMLSGNAKTGGTCFGDCGGPQFLNNTNVIVAGTSFGLNGNCAGVGGGDRIDKPDDLEWLADVLSGDFPAEEQEEGPTAPTGGTSPSAARAAHPDPR